MSVWSIVRINPIARTSIVYCSIRLTKVNVHLRDFALRSHFLQPTVFVTRVQRQVLSVSHASLNLSHRTTIIIAKVPGTFAPLIIRLNIIDFSYNYYQQI